MHIAEGVLSAPVLLTGAAVAVAGVARGLKKLPNDRLMLAGLLGAVFFVGSLIHIPVGVSSAHLILNGIVGMLLGPACFPVIFVALLLQAVLFQFGGLTVLGVNTATMGAGALAAWYLFNFIRCRYPNDKGLKAASFFGGFAAVFLSALFTAMALAGSDDGFLYSAGLLFVSNLPVMFAEGVLTVFMVSYIKRFNPQFLSVKGSV